MGNIVTTDGGVDQAADAAKRGVDAAARSAKEGVQAAQAAASSARAAAEQQAFATMGAVERDATAAVAAAEKQASAAVSRARGLASSYTVEVKVGQRDKTTEALKVWVPVALGVVLVGAAGYYAYSRYSKDRKKRL